MNRVHSAPHDQTSPLPLHLRSVFQFRISAPLARAAQLFGPEGERCWAGAHWNPEFVYPQPAKDVEGAVFTLAYGTKTSVWVNTIFDVSAGRMQYVSFFPETLVSVVDVRLTAMTAMTTGVEVTYTLTALSDEVNDEVRAFAASHRDSGPRWERAIQACLNSGSN